MTQGREQQRQLIACITTELVPAEFFLRQEVVTAVRQGWRNDSGEYPTFYTLREEFCRQLGYEGQRRAIISGHEQVYVDHVHGSGRTMGYELPAIPNLSMLEQDIAELHAANIRTIADYRTRIIPEAEYIEWLQRKDEKERRKNAR